MNEVVTGGDHKDQRGRSHQPGPGSRLPLLHPGPWGGGGGGAWWVGTRASLHSDTVEDLISVEGSSLKDFDARESEASWFSQDQEGQTSGVGHLRGM